MIKTYIRPCNLPIALDTECIVAASGSDDWTIGDDVIGGQGVKEEMLDDVEDSDSIQTPYNVWDTVW